MYAGVYCDFVLNYIFQNVYAPKKNSEKRNPSPERTRYHVTMLNGTPIRFCFKISVICVLRQYMFASPVLMLTIRNREKRGTFLCSIQKIIHIKYNNHMRANTVAVVRHRCRLSPTVYFNIHLQQQKNGYPM